MAKYRSKPTTFGAIQWNGNLNDAIKLCGEVGTRKDGYNDDKVIIHTVSGDKAVPFGDWIIKDAKGLLSHVSPDIFEANYEQI